MKEELCSYSSAWPQSVNIAACSGLSPLISWPAVKSLLRPWNMFTRKHYKYSEHARVCMCVEDGGKRESEREGGREKGEEKGRFHGYELVSVQV